MRKRRQKNDGKERKKSTGNKREDHSPVHLLFPAHRSESAPAAYLSTDCRSPLILLPKAQTNTLITFNVLIYIL